MGDEVTVWREWGTGRGTMSILAWERMLYLLPSITFAYQPEEFSDDDHSIIYAAVDICISFLWITVAMSYEFSPQE